MKKETGMIFNIQRFCTDDGPGIRTTVFMKGCPLRCKWCHNPESLSKNPGIAWDQNKCTQCGKCIQICQQGCHRWQSEADGQVHVLDSAQCQSCGACIKCCPREALSLCGKQYTVDEVMHAVISDERFFRRSGGGLTVSGGEPLWQAEFVVALLRHAKSIGLHTCVETSGAVRDAAIEAVLPYTDLFLFDIKETDEARHLAYVGCSRKQILSNLGKIDAAGVPVKLRCPIIPGVNDREAHFEALAELGRSLQHCVGIQLMPYHELGTGKLRRHGLTEREVFEVPTEEMKAKWQTLLNLKIEGVK
ncbi:MAG: glycyl-radical enzyme activating protein [Cellulosilyticaceae bacterium]